MGMDVVIQPLEKLINALKEKRERVLQRYPTWQATDARVTVFAKYANTLSSAHLGLIFLHEQLSHRQWWMPPHFTAKTPLTDEDIKNKVVEFDRFLRVGCFQMQVSAIESSFRLYVRAIDPTACRNGHSEFEPLYRWLFKRLGLQHYEPLMQLLLSVRNTIHNDGVYFHRLGHNKTLVYKGTTYYFEVGKGINFATWPFHLYLGEELIQMLIEVVESKEVATLAAIYDPFTFAFPTLPVVNLLP
jgi:hypothetical protein